MTGPLDYTLKLLQSYIDSQKEPLQVHLCAETASRGPSHACWLPSRSSPRPMTASCPYPLPSWRRLRDRHNLGPPWHAHLSSPTVALKLLLETYDRSLSMHPGHTHALILYASTGARGPSEASTSRRCSPRPATTKCPRRSIRNLASSFWAQFRLPREMTDRLTD